MSMPLRDLKYLWKKANNDLLFTQATALSYTTLVSLVPVLAVALFLFKAFGGFETLFEKLKPIIEQNIVPAMSGQLTQYIFQFINNIHAGTIGILGVIFLIFTSVSTLATVEKTFNIIWGIRRPRSFARRVTIYWSLLTIGPLLLGASLVLSSKAVIWLQQDQGEISRILVWTFTLTPYIVSGFLFSGLYFFMPNTRINWRDALRAGAITGIVFEIAKVLYATYAVKSVNNNPIYGSLAIFPVFLLWIYVVWLIVLFGAELCCYFQFRRQRIPFGSSIRENLEPFIVSDIIEHVAKAQQNPKGGITAGSLSSALHLTVNDLMPHLEFLENEGWIVSTGSKYYLGVERDKIDLSKILKTLEGNMYIPRSRYTLELYHKFLTLFKG